MTKNNNDLLLVSDDQQLSKAVDEIMKQPIVAVDTESNSLYAYREKVCLIQFSIPGKDYLIDPFKIGNMDLLGKVFKSQKIEKIFHAAEYDLLVLKRDFGFEFNNLFDTMIAAKILGYQRVGLGSLVEIFFKNKLTKKFQTANWGRRPLPQEMLDYARFDTVYLIRMREHLKKELQSSGKLEIAEEDFIRLTYVNGNTPEPQPVNIWRINGSNKFTPRQAAVMLRLAQYRDQKAEKLNRPLFKILGDRTLSEIVNSQPRSREELSNIVGMSSIQVKRHASGIFKAIENGLRDPVIQRPAKERKRSIVIKRIDLLRAWRKEEARDMGVESDVVLPKDVMLNLCEIRKVSKGEVRKVMKDVPWRYKNFGEGIFQILLELDNNRN